MSAGNAFSLNEKVALITGAGRGIGKGIAGAFADAGAAVVLVSRTREQVESVAEEIKSRGGKAIAVAADLTDLNSHDGLITRTVDEFGGIDTVVNCAGGGDMWRPFLEDSVDNLESAFHFNVAAPFELVRLAVPQLLERPGASVVNIVSGAINLQVRGHLSCDASKGALLYATRSMAASLGPRIRVNGIVETEAMKAVVAGHAGVLDQLIGRTRMRRLGTLKPIDRGIRRASVPFGLELDRLGDAGGMGRGRDLGRWYEQGADDEGDQQRGRGLDEAGPDAAEPN